MNNPTLSPSGNAAAYWQSVADDQKQVIRMLRQTLLKIDNLIVSNPPQLKEAQTIIHTTLEATR